MKIDNDSIVTKHTAVHAGNIGDEEVIILGASTDNYISLKGTALAIWETLDQPKSISQICTELGQQYEVDTDELKQDVLEFVTTLTQKGAVQLS